MKNATLSATLWLLAILTISFIPLSSECLADSEYDGILADKNWALQFGIDRNFTLKNFDGYMFAAKNQTSQARAWRYGGSVKTVIGSKDAAVRFYETDNSDWDVSEFELGLHVARLHYASTSDRSKLFFGYGPFFEFDYLEYDAAHGEPFYHRDVSGTGGGLALIGVEFFATQTISLTAEYSMRLAFTYGSERHLENGFYDWDTDGSVITLQAQHVLLGVTAYF